MSTKAQDNSGIRKTTVSQKNSRSKSGDISTSNEFGVDNYNGLLRDFNWLYALLNHVLSSIDPTVENVPAPAFPATRGNCSYDNFLVENNITINEHIVILLSITPYMAPTLLNILKGAGGNQLQYAQFGGVLVGDEKNFWPTVETALYLISENNLGLRISQEQLFQNGNRLLKNNWITLDEMQGEVPLSYKRLSATDEFLSIIKGEHFRPDYTTSFPASYLSTKLDWSDLVLPYDTMEEIRELKVWLQYGDKILQHPELGKKIKPGYRALFYGPPGTGKTLTASLLGKENNLDVYRIDLSMIVSKWVGETEKNLKKVFDLAENKDWVLFFDEADSIFGKRTQTSSSNDRYANQEVSYLLQRIEEFPGMIILASNLKSNIDEAFNRRFQSIIYFPMPDSEIRYNLWQKAFPSDFELDENISLSEISNRYELAGGSIINVVRYCVLKSYERKSTKILLEDLELGIIKEYKKKGKIVS